MADTTISWTEHTWNPVTGCDRVSEGCDNCYALTLAKRLKAMEAKRIELGRLAPEGAKYQNDGDPRTSGPGFAVTTHPGALTVPMARHKPTMWFVNSMSDLFHRNIPDEYIAKVFGVMAHAGRHTFQILTKRPARMRSLLNDPDRLASLDPGMLGHWVQAGHWPLRNVWMGVSIESQQWANIRIPALLDTPATVRFLSCEPLLGPVDLSAWLDPLLCRESCQGAPTGARPTCSVACRQLAGTAGKLGLGIIGGESGHGARPMHIDWARQLRDQFTAARVPFHFKQLGTHLALELGVRGKGDKFDQLPAEFQIRQYPAVTS